LAGDLGFDNAWIAKCLDHAASKKQEQIVPSVTGKVSMAWPLSCDGSSASLHQRRRLKLNCGKLPHRTEARSDLDRAFLLKHRETRHLAADAFTGRGARRDRRLPIASARWVCDQVHQRLKEELGLDHFEGRI
jgi:hypothetical protein